MTELQATYVQLNMLWTKWSRNKEKLDKYSQMNKGKVDPEADGFIQNSSTICHFYSNYEGQGGALVITYWDRDLYRKVMVLITSQNLSMTGGSSENDNWNLLRIFMRDRYSALKNFLDQEVSYIDWGLEHGVYGNR